MAKVKGPLFSITARGNLGESICYKKNRSGEIVTKPPKMPPGASAAQLSQRQLYSDGKNIWNGMGQEEKGEYEAAAAGKTMNGFNMFMSEYLRGEWAPEEITANKMLSGTTGYLNKYKPNDNYSGGTIVVMDTHSSAKKRMHIKQDIEDFNLPPAAEIITAELYMWRVNIYTGEPEGQTIEVCKIINDNYVGAEATWLSCKTGTAWNKDGGDYTEDNPDKAELILSAGVDVWDKWDITDIFKDAILNEGSILRLIGKNSEEGQEVRQGFWWSAIDTELEGKKPYIKIKYR